MSSRKLHPIPARCPITEEPLYVSELACDKGDVRIRGQFEIPRIAQLDEEHRSFLEVFLRSRGVISTVEKELGVSYPTVRSKLDALLNALELEPIKTPKRKPNAAAKRKILKDLEEGKLTPAEAKQKLAGK